VPEPVTAPALKCSTSKALSGRSVTNLFLGGHNELYAPGSLGTCLQFIHVRWQTLWGGQVANRFTNLFQEPLQRSCRRLDEEEFAHLRSHVRVGVHRCPGNIATGGIVKCCGLDFRVTRRPSPRFLRAASRS